MTTYCHRLFIPPSLLWNVFVDPFDEFLSRNHYSRSNLQRWKTFLLRQHISARFWDPEYLCHVMHRQHQRQVVVAFVLRCSHSCFIQRKTRAQKKPGVVKKFFLPSHGFVLPHSVLISLCRVDLCDCIITWLFRYVKESQICIFQRLLSKFPLVNRIDLRCEVCVFDNRNSYCRWIRACGLVIAKQAFLKLKEYFDDKAGQDIYKIVGVWKRLFFE